MCKAEKNEIFVGIGETNSLDWIWMVDTQVTNIHFGLPFL